MQLASKPVASHEHIIFSLKEYKVSLREPWLLWATFLFRLSVPIIGKPHTQALAGQRPLYSDDEVVAEVLCSYNAGDAIVARDIASRYTYPLKSVEEVLLNKIEFATNRAIVPYRLVAYGDPTL